MIVDVISVQVKNSYEKTNVRTTIATYSNVNITSFTSCEYYCNMKPGQNITGYQSCDIVKTGLDNYCVDNQNARICITVCDFITILEVDMFYDSHTKHIKKRCFHDESCTTHFLLDNLVPNIVYYNKNDPINTVKTDKPEKLKVNMTWIYALIITLSATAGFTIAFLLAKLYERCHTQHGVIAPVPG